MKKMLVTAAVFSAASGFAWPALAGDNPSGMTMPMTKPSASKPSPDPALTDAEVVKTDPATGMLTLRHGALANVGMPAMTMAYKAKDAAMVREVHQGDKVRVRVENVGGTLTVVRIVQGS